jgi:hypothetical protein
MVVENDPPIPAWPGLAGRRIGQAREADIITQPLRQILTWWRQLAAGAAAIDGQPRVSDFDIVDFARIAPYLYIAVPVADGFELRIAGEEYIRLFGLKKGWVWRHEADDPIARDSADLLSFVLRHKRPLRSIGRLELSERHWIELEALICPLAGTDGGPGRILGCVAALDDPAVR